VGDVYFRQRCMRKVHELRARGITILFVSHSNGDVKALGDRAMWLERGRVMAVGRTDLVISQYLAAMDEKDARYLEHDPIVAHAGVYQPPPEIEEQILTSTPLRRRRAEILGIAYTITPAPGSTRSSRIPRS